MEVEEVTSLSVAKTVTTSVMITIAINTITVMAITIIITVTHLMYRLALLRTAAGTLNPWPG
jgi:hypothetical protein